MSFVLLVGGWLLRPAGIVLAHGGGTPQLINAPAGGYIVSSWTSPDPARQSEIHISLVLSEPLDDGTPGPPVIGAAVRVVLTSQEVEIAPIGGLATHQNAANRLFYEADLALPVAGWWQATLLIDGPAGAAEISFDLQVLPPTRVNWMLIGGAALVIVVAVFLVQTSQPGDER